MANRALILANGQFDDPAIPDLASPVPDGDALADLLQREDVGGYQVTVVRDQPTSVVRLATQRFFADSGPDDLLILYLSGHGMKDRRGNLHFVTKDTARDALAATAVEARYFHERMRDCQAARQVVFVDTCYSGAFAEGGGFKSVDIAVDRADFTGNAADEADEDEGIAIYTASAGNQVAQEKAANIGGAHQSVFTRHLIAGIATGAADRKQTGWITLEDLFSHIRRELKREGAGQTPQRLLARLPGTVRVAKNPAAQVSLPDDVEAALAGVDAKARLVAVDELLVLARGEAVLLADKARTRLQQLTLHDSAALASAAERALKQLGPMVSGDDAAEDARRQQEEARLQAATDALAQRQAALEARERAAAEALAQAEASSGNPLTGIFRDELVRQRADIAAKEEAKRALSEEAGDMAPPTKTSGAGRIVAVAGAALVGLAIVGAAINQSDPELPEATVDIAPPAPDAYSQDVSTPPEGDPSPPERLPQPEAEPEPTPAPAPATEPAQPLPAAGPNLPQIAIDLAAIQNSNAPATYPNGVTMTNVAASGATVTFFYTVPQEWPPGAATMLQQQNQPQAAAVCADPLIAFAVSQGVRVALRYTSLNDKSYTLTVDRC